MFRIVLSTFRNSLTAISFIAIPSFAQQFIELPKLESVPISDYAFRQSQDRSAFSSAQRSLLVHTDYLLFLKEHRETANNQFKKQQQKFATFLDEETFISSKVFFFVAATAYVYTTQKSYTFGFKNPIHRPLKHYISISETTIITGVRMQF